MTSASSLRSGTSRIDHAGKRFVLFMQDISNASSKEDELELDFLPSLADVQRLERVSQLHMSSWLA